MMVLSGKILYLSSSDISSLLIICSSFLSSLHPTLTEPKLTRLFTPEIIYEPHPCLLFSGYKSGKY